MKNKGEKRAPELELPAYSGLKIDPYTLENGITTVPMADAMDAITAFVTVGNETDPLGMWTGNPKPDIDRPDQDADDL